MLGSRRGALAQRGGGEEDPAGLLVERHRPRALLGGQRLHHCEVTRVLLLDDRRVPSWPLGLKTTCRGSSNAAASGPAPMGTVWTCLPVRASVTAITPFSQTEKRRP